MNVKPNKPTVSRKVLVVHGDDDRGKSAVESHLLQLDLDPIVLHEQPDGGQRVIEKFVASASYASFAVVLLTADDVGASKSDYASGKPLRGRPRQDVIAKLFAFVGKLERAHLFALVRGDVELPSGFGVVFVEMDIAGTWKTKLNEALGRASLPIAKRSLT